MQVEVFIRVRHGRDARFGNLFGAYEEVGAVGRGAGVGGADVADPAIAPVQLLVGARDDEDLPGADEIDGWEVVELRFRLVHVVRMAAFQGSGYIRVDWVRRVITIGYIARWTPLVV